MPKTQNRARILAALPGTAREIATTTGITLGTVRVALSRAKNDGAVVVQGQRQTETTGRGPHVEYVWALPDMPPEVASNG